MCRRLVFSLLLAAACALSAPASAQEPYRRDGYGDRVAPLDQILPIVRQGRAGRFYDAEGPFPDANGGYHYRIKWLTPQGRVIWLDTDARTGRVLGVARGDWREQGPPAFGLERGPYGPPEGRYRGPHDGPFGGRGGWHGQSWRDGRGRGPGG